jgi:hypothetical protein
MPIPADGELADEVALGHGQRAGDAEREQEGGAGEVGRGVERESPAGADRRHRDASRTKPAARTRPRSVGEPVRSRTANASAIGAKALPKSETLRPRKKAEVALGERP